MDYAALIGKQLKDDEVMEILETFGIDVIYEFDRTHENLPDIYWAGALKQGFLLRFNERQILNTVFLYIQPSEGYTAIDPADVPYPLYRAFDDAERDFTDAKILYRASAVAPGASMYKWWIKGDFGAYTRHYQFKGGSLFRLTLSAKNDS